jgi:predicted RNA-binding protein with TRAM domain
LDNQHENTRNIEVGKIYKAKVTRSTNAPGGEALAKIGDVTVRVFGERIDEGDDIRVKITEVHDYDAVGNLVTNRADIF